MSETKKSSGWLVDHFETKVNGKKIHPTWYIRDVWLSQYRYEDYRNKMHRIRLQITVMPNFRQNFKGWIYYLEAYTDSGELITGVASDGEFGKVYDTAEQAKKAAMKDYKWWLEKLSRGIYSYSIHKIKK